MRWRVAPDGSRQHLSLDIWERGGGGGGGVEMEAMQQGNFHRQIETFLPHSYRACVCCICSAAAQGIDQHP